MSESSEFEKRKRPEFFIKAQMEVILDEAKILRKI